MDEEQIYKNFVDRRVLLRCHGGAYLIGTCRSIDGYLNAALENAKYYESPGSGAISIATCYVKGGTLRHIELTQEGSEWLVQSR